MMELALMFAIFRRLSGYPLDAQGNARRDTSGTLLNRDGVQGVVIPMRLQGQERSDLGTDNPDALRLFDQGFSRTALRKVPVWLRGTNDRRWTDVWPCISMMKVDDTAGTIQWSYREDLFMSSSGTQTIRDPGTGVAVDTTYDTFTTRVRPGTWDLWFTFSLWSKDPLEMALMEDAVKGMWDRQGSLPVDNAAGEVMYVNYVRERYAIVDGGGTADPERGVGPTTDSYLRRDYTYRFETMLDNSVNGFGFADVVTRQTILQQFLEAQEVVYRTWQSGEAYDVARSERVELERFG